MHGRKSGAYSIANLGEGDTPDEAVPGVADTERTGAPVLLGDKDGSSSEPNLGAQLPGEHQVAEGGKQQTGPVAVVPVAKEEGLHDCVGPARGPGRGPDGQLLQNGHHIAGGDSERSGLGNRG